MVAAAVSPTKLPTKFRRSDEYQQQEPVSMSETNPQATLDASHAENIESIRTGGKADKSYKTEWERHKKWVDDNEDDCPGVNLHALQDSMSTCVFQEGSRNV